MSSSIRGVTVQMRRLALTANGVVVVGAYIGDLAAVPRKSSARRTASELDGNESQRQ